MIAKQTCFCDTVEGICWKCTADEKNISSWWARLRYGIPWYRIFRPYTKFVANKYTRIYLFGYWVYTMTGDIYEFRLGPLKYMTLGRLKSISLFNLSLMWSKEYVAP